jgi:phage portal protein BeeE
VIVPAREIIHDRFNCLFHPLVGISPLYAAALRRRRERTSSARRHGSRPTAFDRAAS